MLSIRVPIRSARSGQITVIFVAGLMTFIGMLSLTVDVGFFYAVKAQLQAAADVALIASMNQLPAGAAFDEQHRQLSLALTRFQQANFGPGGTTGVSATANTSEPWRVFELSAYMDTSTRTLARAELSCRYNLETSFARVFGLDSVEIGVFSAAETVPAGTVSREHLLARLVE